MTDSEILRLEKVNLVLAKRQLLENIDLDVHQGEFITLIGPNGAGKTTLLRVALGLQKPTGGKVQLKPGLKIGYMPQRLHIDPTFPLSVKRFLSLACSGDDCKVHALLQEVGASQVFESSMHTLSGGELQRVLLARALVREPNLLVLDEPVQGVDVHGQSELYRLISRIRTERGCSVLMVSHDLHLVMASTDRVLCVNRHICCSGTPEAVTRHPAYAELFGDHAVEQLAIYVHDQSHQHDECAHCQKKALK